MAILAVEDVYAGYDGSQVLHGVSISVEEQEIVTIIGPNGAGKSTLLKVVMGFLTPSRGSVRLRGDDITGLRPDQRVREGIAYVPQLENIFPSLTVEENLRMGGYLLDRETLRGRAEEMYETFPRLAERKRLRVKALSGGERQMLAMARALMAAPMLLLLDEPSAALSPRMAGEVFDKVMEINAAGRAIVIVEQEAQRSLEISSRGYVLADGRNAFEDRAHNILANEKIREAFLGAG
ncbi:ABC transporter ATP-binding protein [Chelativorans xinjiangense]|uniref:ABC transporter ATP-binding protein n=1 Tax=Chelativorans xinjiangense TaxID=2681485 RepID=UPI001359A78E|nr:ABC transporter ATP-binding protein [Chelativorans xinjiangense]